MSKAALESGLEEVIGDIEDESSDAEFLVTTGDLLRELNSNTELRARLPKKDRKVWDELVGLLEEAIDTADALDALEDNEEVAWKNLRKK